MGMNERTVSARARFRRWAVGVVEDVICAGVLLGAFYAAAYMAYLFQVLVGVA